MQFQSKFQQDIFIDTEKLTLKFAGQGKGTRVSNTFEKEEYCWRDHTTQF